MLPRYCTAWPYVVVVCGCGAGADALREPSQPTDIPVSGGERGERPQPAALPATAEAACAISSPSVRLRINEGQTLPTGSGLSITNAGASHDNYGPAGFDLLITLRFQRGEERVEHMPSFRDRHTAKVLGHCYRLLDGAAGAVLIEVTALDDAQDEPVANATLEGAAACTITDDNGPLEGGNMVVSGCGPEETCVCEAQAGYSCSGHCAGVRKGR